MYEPTKKRRKKQISGVFEIRAAHLSVTGSAREKAGSNPAQRTFHTLARLASELCLLIPINLFERET
jgi:hypothetical protein